MGTFPEVVHQVSSYKHSALEAVSACSCCLILIIASISLVYTETYRNCAKSILHGFLCNANYGVVHICVPVPATDKPALPSGEASFEEMLYLQNRCKIFLFPTQFAESVDMVASLQDSFFLNSICKVGIFRHSDLSQSLTVPFLRGRGQGAIAPQPRTSKAVKQASPAEVRSLRSVRGLLSML